jgi:hypothetical protein
VKDFPPSVPELFLAVTDALPFTDISPANAVVATKDPANAVRPSFLNCSY